VLSRGITNARHERYSVRPIHIYHRIHVSATIINVLIVITFRAITIVRIDYEYKVSIYRTKGEKRGRGT
jgi:hypothetical protein